MFASNNFFSSAQVDYSQLFKDNFLPVNLEIFNFTS